MMDKLAAGDVHLRLALKGTKECCATCVNCMNFDCSLVDGGAMMSDQVCDRWEPKR